MTDSRDADLRRLYPLVRQIARRLVRRLPASIEVDDLTQVGMIGLADALTRFDPAAGQPIEAFASRRITGAMTDMLRAGDWAPRGLRQHQRRIEAARSTLRQALLREPRASEVAAAVDMDVTDMARVECDAAHMVPHDDDTQTLTDAAADVLSALIDAQRIAALQAAVDRLPPRLRTIMLMRHGEGLGLREIGDQLGVSDSRICALHRRAVTLLALRLRDF